MPAADVSATMAAANSARSDFYRRLSVATLQWRGCVELRRGVTRPVTHFAENCHVFDRRAFVRNAGDQGASPSFDGCVSEPNEYGLMQPSVVCIYRLRSPAQGRLMQSEEERQEEIIGTGVSYRRPPVHSVNSIRLVS